MAKIKLFKFSVILILAFTWDECALSASHHSMDVDGVDFNTMKSYPLNRLRHHNNHQHNHQSHKKIYLEQISNIHRLSANRKNNNDLHEILSPLLPSYRKNDFSSFKHQNRVDEFRRKSTTTTTTTPTSHSINHNNKIQYQHYHHHHNLSPYKKHHQRNVLEAVKSSASKDYQKNVSGGKIYDGINSQSIWSKLSSVDTKNLSNILENSRSSTISPFDLRKVTALPRFNETLEKGVHKKTSNARNDNDFEDYYYYDENDEGDDDNVDEDDEDVNVRDDNDDDIDTDEKLNEEEINLNDRFQNRKNRGTAKKFVEKYDGFMDDYQFDEPINRITTEKPQSLTEFKWREYGTAEAVENSRRKTLTESQLVAAHITRIHQEGMCKHPRPKIVQINEASKRYVPHCTVLYRCGDDTGCCHSDSHKCVAKNTTTVDLYFYAIPVGMKDPVVEILTFVNHTECHCVNRLKNSRTIRSHSSLTAKNQINHNYNHLNTTNNNIKKVSSNFCQCTRHYDVFEESIGEIRNFQNDEQNRRRGTLPLHGNKCSCDCLNSNSVCQSLKLGLEGLTLEDRRCIVDERCTIPTCEFGDYITNYGRCPRGQHTRKTYPTNY